jgi:hypothetical protein
MMIEGREERRGKGRKETRKGGRREGTFKEARIESRW